ncbi:hypothetical protein [Actinomadura opuntiae]|uniref:hypothetical protein n=1 Tax=Actinomadura sp. OS1-43 TaxID=604315 RepID=UPI00255B2486|nr:hypothetical protein [Actinomadura sp. OS1-43]MDL4819563.1 hypothetical protein [Actinomadura sp. OS1-43]
MRADELLTEVEPLPFGERCRRVAGLRGQAGTPELAALLDELAERGHYERSLALFVASAVRDAASLDHIARATGDPDAELACAAIRLAVRYGDGPEPFLARLGDAPAAIRSAIYDAVRKWWRTDLADALVGPVADRWGIEEAAALLPTCSSEVVAERIDATARAVPNWASLGGAHPGIMLDHAEQRLAEAGDSLRAGWWSLHGAGIAAAASHDPGRVVGLLERYGTGRSLPYALDAKAGLLLDAEPDRMVRLLTSERYRGSLRRLLWRRSVRDRLAKLDNDSVTLVAHAVREDGTALRLLLKAFPPSRREHVFDAAMVGVDLSAAELDEPLLDVLPHAVRIREARRMLGLQRISEAPARSWSITAFLPYDEALPVLGALTRRPDADDRATGYALLIACAGRSRDPGTVTAMLESLVRLRNEQDPVRYSALNALANVPEGLLRAEHAAAVGRFADDALAARDCSFLTRQALGRIAAAFCRQGAVRDDADLVVFGLDLVERLIGHAGAIHLGRLDRALRHGQEHRLAVTLAPYLQAAARRDDHRLALLLVRALGRRAHHVQPFQDALEAALDARSDAVLRDAIELWLAPPGARAERVDRVIAKDASAVAVPAVLATIARERTDLLHLVLGGSAPSGRFQRADVAYVPHMRPSWMRRWTSRQRDAYLGLLTRVAGDATQPGHAREGAVRAIATVPGVDAERLRRYLASDDDGLCRAALTAVAWTASPQAVLPDLLAHAATDHAHVAMYAMTRAARFVPPSALAATLGPALREGKITARKEALRILLHNRVPDALALVAAAWDDPGQHRDVRAAIVSAVRPHLAEDAARRILTEAAGGPRDLARQVLGTPPLSVDERFRGFYASLVLRVARSDDAEARDAALPNVPPWAPWAPDAPSVLSALVTGLGAAHGWRPALDALVRCVVDGFGAPELGAAAAALAAEPDEPDAGAERDLPAFQRLSALVEAVREAASRDRDTAERAIAALDGRLPADLAGELAAATFRWDAPDAATALDALAGRCTGGALAVRQVAEALIPWADDDWDDEFAEYISVPDDAPDPEDVLPHAERLAARGDLAGGLFAAALTGGHAPRAGWPDAWRSLLRSLRAHPDPDVAFTARRIRTAQE